MELEPTLILMALNTLDNERMINKKERALKIGRMDQNMRANTEMESSKGKANCSFQMAVGMKESSLKIKLKASEFISGRMGGNMKANEKIIKCTGRENLYGWVTIILVYFEILK